MQTPPCDQSIIKNNQLLLTQVTTCQPIHNCLILYSLTYSVIAVLHRKVNPQEFYHSIKMIKYIGMTSVNDLMLVRIAKMPERQSLHHGIAHFGRWPHFITGGPTDIRAH